ncbi:MAG: LPS-assembly protein LptD, partial [Limnobacter sp.]|nr:LPS-assembly protein LptD [Limnobacter sp.]
MVTTSYPSSMQRTQPLPHFPRTRMGVLLAICLAELASSVPAHAQQTAAKSGALELSIDSTLLGGSHAGDNEEATYLSADKLFSNSDEDTLLEGNVEIQQKNLTLTGDRIRYSPITDSARAEGNLVIEQPGLRISGPSGTVKVGSRVGFIEDPAYELTDIGGKGSADKLTFDGVDTLTLENPNYTVCEVPNPRAAKQADWYVQADELELDQSAETGRAKNARIVFQNVPILATPYLSFPTTDRRKSGFLAPSIGSSNRGGTEFTLPYYWNIAPNRDVTLYPRVISSRGFQLGTDTRYLGQVNQGSLKLDYLPSDQKTNTDRYALNFDHVYSRDHITADLNVNKVSDDQYFVDFSRSQAVASQRILERSGSVKYQGNGWQATSRVVRYQTLQLANDVIAQPYDRLPEVNLSAYPVWYGPMYVKASASYTDFANPTLVEGGRATANLRAEMPIVRPAYQLTTAASLQHTSYNLDR